MANPGLNLESIIHSLSRTPGLVRFTLEGQPESAVHANEGEGTWSPFDVIGHLIHGEHTDWIPRMKIILNEGTSRPFDPFDREGMFQASRGKTLAELLDDFQRLRKENLEILKGLKLTAKDFIKQGMHPSLGVVNLGQLLATWVVHDLDHVQQIVRVLAKQSREEVGPWFEYLSILR